jgi:hypothetical protein
MGWSRKVIVKVRYAWERKSQLQRSLLGWIALFWLVREQMATT